MRIGHVGQEIAQGINVEGASWVIDNRLIARTEVLDIGKQKMLKPEITFPVGKLFMVVFGAVKEKKGPVDQFMRDSSRESKELIRLGN
jgi:hypothetical protein